MDQSLHRIGSNNQKTLLPVIDNIVQNLSRLKQVEIGSRQDLFAKVQEKFGDQDLLQSEKSISMFLTG